MPPLTEASVKAAIEALKESLANANHLPGSTSFGPAADHFQDLVEIPGFLSLGYRIENPEIQLLLKTVADQMARNGKGTVDGLLTVRLPENRMVHGGCMLNGRIASLCWFEVERFGLLLVIRSDGATEMVRLTTIPVDPNIPLAGGGVGQA